MSRQQQREVVLYEAQVEPIRKGAAQQAFTHLEGRAVPYGVWTSRGWYMESVGSGSLDKSISEAGGALPLLTFHDANQWPIGISEDWDSRDDGLHGIWRLDEGAEAQRAAKLASDGLMRWMSVAISPIRSEWEYVAEDQWDPAKGPDFMDKVTRVEARLLETSLVPTPAFGQAQVTLVHSDERPRAGRELPAHLIPRPHLAAWRQELERIREADPLAR